MNWDDLFTVFAIAAVASFVLSLKSLFDVRALRAQLARLTDKLPMYEHRLLRLAERIDGLATAPRPPNRRPPTVAEATPTPAPEPVREQPVEPAPVVASPTEEVPPTLAAAPPQWDWERLLVENWLVWLGGAALALGGGFLVKLSIDYGLLTPAVRVVLGLLLGIGLAVGGEWVRRREVAQGGDPAAPSYVPQALAAAGAATVFASLYAAHQLYGLLPSGLALPLLALTAGATVAQSLRMGPYVAALGLVGAFVVPLLVESDEPHALPLFAYLAVVTAGSLGVLRHRAWWWLAWLSLAAVGAAMAGQRRRPRDADRGAVPAGANRLVYGVSPRRPASRVSRRYCRHPDGAGGDARGDVGGRDRAVSPGECRWVRHDRRRRGLCRGDRVSGPGLSRRQGRRRDRARRRPRRDAARELEPPACHPGDEPVGLPAAARPYRRLHDCGRAVCRTARRRPVSAVAAGGAAGAMGGAVRRDPAAGIGHRLLAAAEIRCRYRLDLDRAGAGCDRTRRRLLGRAAAQRATRNDARRRDRNRPRRLCARRAGQHDRRCHPGARRGLADRCLGIAPAGARLDRRPLPIAGAALAGARRRRCGADPAGAQPLCAELRTRADADLQLVALRLWRAGGLVHRRHAPVRQPQGRCAGRGTRSRQLAVFAVAAEPRIDARDLWPADACPGRRFRLGLRADRAVVCLRRGIAGARRIQAAPGVALGRADPADSGDTDPGGLAIPVADLWRAGW